MTPLLTRRHCTACLLVVLLSAPLHASPADSFPAFSQVKAAWRSSEARLLDRHGELLQEFRVDPSIRRTDWTPLVEVSPALIVAVLRAEDRRFFEHGGVDWLAAGKAALSNWLSAKPRGASTLTMQLAALLDAQFRASSGRRDVAEKWRQMQAARELEQSWNKADILEAYLNLAPFRGELTGIDAATRGLFDKRPAGLSDAESLILAALIRAPNAKPNDVAKRVCALADGLPGMASCAALKALTRNTLSGRYPIVAAANWAPHLALRLLGSANPSQPPAGNELLKLAGETVGSEVPPFPKGGAGGISEAAAQANVAKSPSFPLWKRGRPPPQALSLVSTVDATSALEKKGGSTNLRSSLDTSLQRHVIATLNQQLAHLAGREVSDAAALVLDNASGEVLAYASVSARDSVSPESDGVRAPRQAGSTLKPFLYGLALEKGLLTAASPLEDAPLSITTAGGQYAPQNYDHEHRGLVSVRTALAGSLNIPAVQTLKLVGLEPFAARLARFGFDGLTEDADFYGYSLALGSLDVTLEQETNAYRALANGGVYSPLRFTTSTKNSAAHRVQSRESTFLVADILSDRQARATTFGLENPLATRFWTAVKTGTSKDMRDNWCLGFSSRYTVGVWIGNFSGAPMHDVSGISGAAPAWAAIMQRLHAETPSSPPDPPKWLTRKLVQPPGEAPRREWFLPGGEPAGATWNAASPPPEIVNPGDGGILALDPDIPPTRQRLLFQASHAPASAWWQLDETRLETADWLLERGHHALSLKDRDGRILDQVRFEVR
ncbi:MAG: transglycosylase domain-containing protein [Gallionellaceae bacterium]|nr:transglycosylase domain-containing protein [Gallionellaceae bacterium]